MTKGNRNEVKILFIKVEIEVTVIFSKSFFFFNLIYLRRNLVSLDMSKILLPSPIWIESNL